MPSFDIVSEIDEVEVTNAVSNSTRELETRFDFRGVKQKSRPVNYAVRPNYSDYGHVLHQFCVLSDDSGDHQSDKFSEESASMLKSPGMIAQANALAPDLSSASKRIYFSFTFLP